MITLQKISILHDDMKDCIALDVKPEQKGFVASNAYSLAEAYCEKRAYAAAGVRDAAEPYAVYQDGEMVGFAMYGYFTPDYEDGDEPSKIDRVKMDISRRYKRITTAKSRAK